MKREKKSPHRVSWKIKGFALLLILVIVTSSMLSTSFSRFSSAADGFDRSRAALFNFNINRQRSWTYSFLGATQDLSDDERDNDGYKTLHEGHMLAPGQSGSFEITFSFISEVDSFADVSATAVTGTGAFADIPASLGTVAMRFIVSPRTIDNPDFVGGDWVNVSNLEARLESVMANCFGPGGLYKAGGAHVLETVTVYWEWVENIDDDADTALGLEVYNSKFHSNLDSTLDIKLSVSMVQVD